MPCHRLELKDKGLLWREESRTRSDHHRAERERQKAEPAALPQADLHARKAVGDVKQQMRNGWENSRIAVGLV